MNDREELSRKLLEENGLGGGPLGRKDREDLRAVIESERRRDARVRNLMLLSWAAFVILFVGILAVFYGWRFSGAETTEVSRGVANLSALLVLGVLLLAFIVFIVAVVATVSWGLRLAFGPRGVDERLERIEAQLARLEAEQIEGRESDEAGNSR